MLSCLITQIVRIVLSKANGEIGKPLVSWVRSEIDRGDERQVNREIRTGGKVNGN